MVDVSIAKNLLFTDRSGHRIIFIKEVYKKKLAKHTELPRTLKQIKHMIEQVLAEPDLECRDAVHEKRRCYYKVWGFQNVGVGRLVNYTKIVVRETKRNWYIITIWWDRRALIEYVVNERKYTNYKELWKSPNSSI